MGLPQCHSEYLVGKLLVRYEGEDHTYITTGVWKLWKAKHTMRMQHGRRVLAAITVIHYTDYDCQVGPCVSIIFFLFHDAYLTCPHNVYLTILLQIAWDTMHV